METFLAGIVRNGVKKNEHRLSNWKHTDTFRELFWITAKEMEGNVNVLASDFNPVKSGL